MYNVDLQVFPSKKPFFFFFVCLVSSPHAPLFSLAAQPMMLQRWKTAGVIFTGGQGTWVIKLASIFHSLKKTRAPLHLPCQSTRPLWEVCIVRRRVWESEDVHKQMRTHSDKEVLLQTCEITSTHRKKTHRPFVANMRS